jgi:hypothetical protein
MFIVKAEVRKDIGPNGYQLFTAESVQVAPTRSAQCPGPSPEIDVDLCDRDGRCFKTLYVGLSIDHYCAIYIMNAQGKTIDSVYPGQRSINPPPTSMAA